MGIDGDLIQSFHADAEYHVICALQEYRAAWRETADVPDDARAELVRQARAEVLAAAEAYRLAQWLMTRQAPPQDLPF